MNPYVEILVCLVPGKRNVHALDDATLFEVANSSVRRKIFGREGSLRERGVSGPKKITVGCVILTVPRRQSVNHAFTAEIANDIPAIVKEIGSATGTQL